MQNKKEKDIFTKLFIPDYDELTLYLMSYVCLLFFLVNNPPHKWRLDNIKIQIDDFALAGIFSLFILGLILCFYHAFTKREKTLIEKKIMLLFAVLLCGFSGIWGGSYVLEHSSGIITLFPIWNILSSFMLFGSFRSGMLKEDNVSDENVGLRQVLLSSGVVTLIFICCEYYFKVNWAATFSICITWVTTFNSTLNSTLFKARMPLTHF